MTEEPVWQAAPAPELDWEAGGGPVSTLFDDRYFSSVDGLAESQHVFLNGNQLPAAWQHRRRFTIAETGFGSGLNFLAAWSSWREQPGACQQLHYIGYEKYPLRLAQLQRSLQEWQQLQPLTDELIAAWPAPMPGQHRLLLNRGRVILDLIIGDVIDSVTQQLDGDSPAVDCWFLDGFTPARNPDMWRPELYQHMASLSSSAASFATFTAASDVRRGLTAAGFKVNKASGYGIKREMYFGQLQQQPPQPPPRQTPWHLQPAHDPAEQHALVLGAGLAGASVAAALARRGWLVTVLDQHQAGDGASGNRQGVLYTRLSHRFSELNEFALHSFSYATRLYRDMFHNQQLLSGRDGALCGALHLLPDWSDDHELAVTVASLPELVRYLDPAASALHTGLPTAPPGLWYPNAGWMYPAAVCRALLAAPGIELRENCGPLQLRRDGTGWSACDSSGAALASAPIAVIATGAASMTASQTDWLPLQEIRGQTTDLPSTGVLSELQSVICHSGYVAPAVAGIHCIGATFAIGDTDTRQRSSDHETNIAALCAAIDGVGRVPAETAGLGGRVGFRCASPDYLPLAGPVPDRAAFIETYADLRRNARRVIPRIGNYLAGLYISTGHGSRGLTSTPLSAELIAAQICAEPLPTSTALARALNPARFLIRDLGRGRIQGTPE